MPDTLIRAGVVSGELARKQTHVQRRWPALGEAAASRTELDTGYFPGCSMSSLAVAIGTYMCNGSSGRLWKANADQ